MFAGKVSGMNKQPDISADLQLLLQKARRSLAAARRHIEAGDYDFASSRAYYAAFYAMQAVLLTKSLTPAKHSGVIRAFNQHFIKTGIFPTEFSKSIGWLFSERQTGDYALGLSIAETDAIQDVETAEKVVHAIVEYLIRERFLGEG
jgi:uncharacterized protein (UPF0332 family)